MTPPVPVEQEKPKMKERQRQLREDAFLNAASTLLAAKGFTAMTLEDVIADVGTSKTTLYQHFSSKEDLVVSVLRREIGGSLERLRVLEESSTPREAIRSMVTWIVERRFGAGMPCRFDVTGVLSAKSQDSLREQELVLVAALEALFARVQNDDGSSGAPPLLSAQCLISVLKDWSYAGLLAEGRLDLREMEAGLTRLLLG